MSLSYEEALGLQRPSLHQNPCPEKCPGCCEKMDEIRRLERHIKSLKTKLKNVKEKKK